MDSSEWLRRFHAGDRSVLSEVYREHFDDVYRAAASRLPLVDAEGVVHEVFCRLLSDERMRSRFQGGSLSAWLCTVARNLAVDVWRRSRREICAPPEEMPEPQASEEPGHELDVAARRLVERFRQEQLPAKWAPVFEARFIEGLSQRETARRLGLPRTTIAYREARIRWRLRRFVLKGGRS